MLQDPLFVWQGARIMPTPFTRNKIEQVREGLQILEVNVSQSYKFVPERSRRNSPFYVGISRGPHFSAINGPFDPRLPRNVHHNITSQAQKWLLNEPFVVIARRGHPAIAVFSTWILI
jgi:hypothetical protein